jgi:hypothetical protein
MLGERCYIENKLLARRILYKGDYLCALNLPTQDLLVNSCSGAIDVVADTTVAILVNNEIVLGGEMKAPGEYMFNPCRI